MGTTGTARFSRSCSFLPLPDQLRIEGLVAWVRYWFGSMFFVGHEAAQLLGRDVGALVPMANRSDFRLRVAVAVAVLRHDRGPFLFSPVRIVESRERDFVRPTGRRLQ